MTANTDITCVVAKIRWHGSLYLVDIVTREAERDLQAILLKQTKNYLQINN